MFLGGEAGEDAYVVCALGVGVGVLYGDERFCVGGRIW